MNTSFSPKNIPKIPAPISGGGAFWGAGGRARALPPPLPDSNAVIRVKQHFLQL